jgi:anaerobic magnesium-protoporphyrin IX monomethyl ester cyclase
LCYVAASLREAGYNVDIIDCTFMKRDDALKRARSTGAEVVGIYSMMTMREESITFARHLRDRCDLLIAGGPLPSCDPLPFMRDFDVVVRGEGEQTMIELLRAQERGLDFDAISGVVCRKGKNRSISVKGGNTDDMVFTNQREHEKNLDSVAFPARDLLPNEKYIEYGKRRFGYAVSAVITTRGCPFRCEFCSNAVFGISYRERSPANVVDEVEQVLSLGYDRIHRR